MGRKRASKNTDRAQVLPSNGSIQSPMALGSEVEIPLPGITSPENPTMLVDGVETRQCHAKSPAKEQVTLKPPTSSKKKSKFGGGSVRRSERIKSSVVSHPNTNCGIEVIENITVSDGEKDEADTQLEQVLGEPGLELELPLEHKSDPESEPELADDLGEKNLDEKVDCALQRIDAVDKKVKSLKSEVDGHFSFCEAPSGGYRSMYIDSQKKIEALTIEIQRLNGKLENALGKIEVYEKEIRVLVDALDKTKDAVKDTLISNVAKTLEAAVNVSNQAMQIHNGRSASAVKRKRNES